MPQSQATGEKSHFIGRRSALGGTLPGGRSGDKRATPQGDPLTLRGLLGGKVLRLAGVAHACARDRGLSRRKSYLAKLSRVITPQKAPPYNPGVIWGGFCRITQTYRGGSARVAHLARSRGPRIITCRKRCVPSLR